MNRLSSSVIRNMCSTRLVWVDLEMTGLSIKGKGDRIIEAACIITDILRLPKVYKIGQNRGFLR